MHLSDLNTYAEKAPLNSWERNQLNRMIKQADFFRGQVEQAKLAKNRENLFTRADRALRTKPRPLKRKSRGRR